LLSTHENGPVTSFDLSGTRALVTGCRRGMGLAIAEALAEAGADIVGASLKLERDGSEAQDRVEAHGRTFTGYRADLASETGAAELAAAVLRDGHQIDILVNHAGVITRTPALEHDDEAWRRVVQTNLTSAFVLARELGRPMVERGRGKIIFTASLLSFQGGVNVVSYAAAKSGVAGVVRALANEWAPHGVNVNAIVPGYIATDQTQALWDDPVRAQEILDRIPAGRWGTPTDVAGAAVFLASPASDYVHGALLPVDGGWLAR
jgi:2-deoxy-D-gluconate 3-dehydrogenase